LFLQTPAWQPGPALVMALEEAYRAAPDVRSKVALLDFLTRHGWDPGRELLSDHWCSLAEEMDPADLLERRRLLIHALRAALGLAQASEIRERLRCVEQELQQQSFRGG